MTQIWWYLARASGLVAWLMLTASVLWGIVLSTKAFPKHRRPAWLLDLHRWLGALAVALIVLHVGSILADTYTNFALADVLVPFRSTWRPTAVAFGIVAAWLLVAIELSSQVMRSLPRRVWHGIHLASYAVFVLGSIHGVLSGSDRSQPLSQATAALAIITVIAATGYRLRRRSRSRRRSRPTTVAADPARVGL